MLGLLNTVLSKGNTLLTYVKDGLVMANRFLTPPKLTFPVDASAEFNGTSDYIQLDNPFSYTNHTIAAWVYANDTASAKNIFNARDAFNDGYALYMDANESIFYRFGDGSSQSTISSSTTNANEWFFVVGTYNGSTQTLYVDGSVATSASTSKVINNSTNATIGAVSYNVSSVPMDGNLANVAIWNRALSSDEINSVMWKGYNALATTEKSGLQAWYKLEKSELFDASNTSTTNLEEYAKLNSVTFEGKACLQTALNALPDITDARLYSGRYDARVSADGGTVEALNCVETELNALL